MLRWTITDSSMTFVRLLFCRKAVGQSHHLANFCAAGSRPKGSCPKDSWPDGSWPKAIGRKTFCRLIDWPTCQSNKTVLEKIMLGIEILPTCQKPDPFKEFVSKAQGGNVCGKELFYNSNYLPQALRKYTNLWCWQLTLWLSAKWHLAKWCGSRRTGEVHPILFWQSTFDRYSAWKCSWRV